MIIWSCQGLCAGWHARRRRAGDFDGVLQDDEDPQLQILLQSHVDILVQMEETDLWRQAEMNTMNNVM